MSRIVVQKYGGSSVSNIDSLKQVAQRVVQTVQAGWQVVVVVSAMGNTTNELIALAKSVSSSPTRRELDLLVSVGERVSMTLLAMAINDLGVEARSFTGSQSGIITNENHVSARIVEVKPHRIVAALEGGCVAIVAGFQGVSREKEVTTLGRGGSDTTAVALAAAVQAEYCEICSDVDGVYTADPRVAHSATKIDNLPMDAAIAMTRGGSKVLQAQAIEYAKSQGIAICANATSKPVGQGTLISPGPIPSLPVAIALDDQLLSFNPSASENLERIKGALRYAYRRENQLYWLIDLRNLHDLSEVSQFVNARPVAVISLVGGCDDPGVFVKASSVLASLDPIAEWSSMKSYMAVIEPQDADMAQKKLHFAFFE